MTEMEINYNMPESMKPHKYTVIIDTNDSELLNQLQALIVGGTENISDEDFEDLLNHKPITIITKRKHKVRMLLIRNLICEVIDVAEVIKPTGNQYIVTIKRRN